jgi:hypothetical protein
LPQFDPELVQVMRDALEEVMTRVPAGCSTPAIKAYLAECILKAAAQGQTSYDGLVAAAADQIQVILSLFIATDDEPLARIIGRRDGRHVALVERLRQLWGSAPAPLRA